MTTDVMLIGSTDTDHVTPGFTEALAAMSSPAVLEIGTRRWQGDLPTHHGAWMPEDACLIKTDCTEGYDVDIVTDAHHLDFPSDVFDAVIAVSVWEHLKRPWIAAYEVARVLRPGGHAYVATHQSFPIHGYPDDYWRFTDAGLDLLFADAGLDTVAVGYSYPCTIDPGVEVTRWNPTAPAFLTVIGHWTKPC